MGEEHCRFVAGAGGTRLCVDVTGSGPPVVLVPGLGYGAWSWFRQVEGLRQHHRVLAVDNRGTGRSDKPIGEYSIEVLADDLICLLEDLVAAEHDEPAHLVGASMGGYVAMSVARRRPELVGSLALIATSPGGPGCPRLPAATRAQWLSASELDPPDYARATMPLSFGPGWTDHHPEAFEQILSRRLAHPTPAHVWAAQFAGCEAFLDAGLGATVLAQPAMVIHGTADRVLPFDNASHLLSHLADAELLRLEGAGHLCWIERADAVNQAIAALVARTTASTR